MAPLASRMQNVKSDLMENLPESRPLESFPRVSWPCGNEKKGIERGKGEGRKRGKRKGKGRKGGDKGKKVRGGREERGEGRSREIYVSRK